MLSDGLRPLQNYYMNHRKSLKSVIPAQAGIQLPKFSLLILSSFKREMDSGLRWGSVADLRS